MGSPSSKTALKSLSVTQLKQLAAESKITVPTAKLLKSLLENGGAPKMSTLEMNKARWIDGKAVVPKEITVNGCTWDLVCASGDYYMTQENYKRCGDCEGKSEEQLCSLCITAANSHYESGVLDGGWIYRNVANDDDVKPVQYILEQCLKESEERKAAAAEVSAAFKILTQNPAMDHSTPRRLAVVSPHRAQGDEIDFLYAGTMLGGLSLGLVLGRYLFRRFSAPSKAYTCDL